MIKLEKGTFFTVTKWIDSTDKSYIGDCLEAIEIDHPFVNTRNHEAGLGYEFTLNLDRVEIRELSKKFVESVLTRCDRQKEKEDNQDEQ